MMTAIGIVVGVALLGAVAFFLVNGRAAGKVLHLGRAKAGWLGRKAEEVDPVGQMRQAAEDATGQIGKARDALVRAEAAKSALERQVKADQAEVNTLTARINRRLTDGVPASDPAVTDMANDLARAKRYLGENQKQLDDNTRLCNEALAVIKRENERVGELARRADRLEVRLDVSEAQAAVADVAGYLQPGALKGLGHSAGKFEEIAERRIDENNAKLRVAASLGGGDREEEAATADGEAALAEILAARNSVRSP